MRVSARPDTDPLQQRGVIGWCAYRGSGWSVLGDEVSVHIELGAIEFQKAG